MGSKNIFLFLLATTLLGCRPHYEKSDFLGTWDLLTSKNVETDEVERALDTEVIFVNIREDSLLMDGIDAYSWHIKGDSVVIDGLITVYIAELTRNKLKVRFEGFNLTEATFEKRE